MAKEITISVMVIFMRYSCIKTMKGQFVKGERNGFGVISFVDGQKIDGIWSADLLNGECSLRRVTGQIHKGVCQRNQMFIEQES